MAKSGFIDLNIENTSNITSIHQLIEEFKNQKWTLDVKGEIIYTPLHDNEEFNWISTSTENYQMVMDILQKKEECSELISICLYHTEENVGMDVLIYPMYHKITCGLHINRKTILNLDITDFSWYIKMIAPMFKSLNIEITSIECLDG